MCVEYFNEDVHGVKLLQNQLPHEKLAKKVAFKF